MNERAKFYSVRRAITGSFFAAACAGIKPETSVSKIETHTMIKAVNGGSAAMFAMPVSDKIIMLITIDMR